MLQITQRPRILFTVSVARIYLPSYSFSTSSNFSRSTRERIMTRATNVERKKLLSLGICFGKFTKTGKFRLHITALDYLAPYAKVSLDPIKKFAVWVHKYILSINARLLNIFCTTVQGLGEAIRRVVVLVRKSRIEGWSWSHYRKYPSVSIIIMWAYI